MSKNYPDAAGFKEKGGASQDNAERLEASGRALTLRERVKGFFDKGMTGTADEVAACLRVHFLSIRPRLSELRNMGVIEPTAHRGNSITGNTATVWRRTLKSDLFE